MAIIDPQVPRNIILGAFKEQILNFDRDYGTAATNESLTAIDALVDYGYRLCLWPQELNKDPDLNYWIGDLLGTQSAIYIHRAEILGKDVQELGHQHLSLRETMRQANQLAFQTLIGEAEPFHGPAKGATDEPYQGYLSLKYSPDCKSLNK